MILPKGSIRKFVKMVIGLIIILVIINPFIKLVQGDIDIEKEVIANVKKQYDHKANDYSEFEANQEQQVKEIYSSQIKKEIAMNIIEKTVYQIDECQVEIYEDKDNENYGQIQAINLILSEKYNKKDINIEKANNIKDIKIDINIKGSLKDKKDLESKDSFRTYPKDLENIRSEISKKFEISKEKILINLKTKE